MAVVLPMASSGPAASIVHHPTHHPSLRARAWTTGSTTDTMQTYSTRFPPQLATQRRHPSPEDEVDEMDEDEMEDEDDEFDDRVHHHRSHTSLPATVNRNQLDNAHPGGIPNSTTTNTGVHRTRRPRRRADEVERLYKCTWNGCEKSYGTLSHLNDHVRLQRHGEKREPHEFKEARRIWRQERKSRRLREHAMHAAQQAQAQTTSQHYPQRNHHLAPPTSAVYPPHAVYAPSVGTDSPYRPPVDYRQHRSRASEERDGYHPLPRVPLAVGTTSPSGAPPTVGSAFLQTTSALISPRPSTLDSPLMSFHNPTVDDSNDAQKSIRLPSIAELRLDLSLDEYEAQTALGALSNPAAGLSSRSQQQQQAPRSPFLPMHSVRHHHHHQQHQRRTRADSLSSSPNLKQAGLAPPPPYHVYSQQLQQDRNSLSPEHTRFRLAAPIAPTSPSASSVDFSVSSASASYTQPSPFIYPPGGRSRASSQSHPTRRPSHSNPSRPSTSTSSSTNSTNTSAYRLSTPTSYIPPSSSSSSSLGQSHSTNTVHFIPAPPPRGMNNGTVNVNDTSSDGTPTSTTTTATIGGGGHGGAVGLTGMEPRRKRRKYEEIERRYLCGWNGCTKAYGTLNHLNDHVSLQNHGPKRRSNEF